LFVQKNLLQQSLAFCLRQQFARVKRAKVCKIYSILLFGWSAAFCRGSMQMRDSAIHQMQFCVSSCMFVQFRLAQRNAQKHVCLALRAGNVASNEQQDVLAVCGALALGHDFKMFLMCCKSVDEC